MIAAGKGAHMCKAPCVVGKLFIRLRPKFRYTESSVALRNCAALSFVVSAPNKDVIQETQRELSST